MYRAGSFCTSGLRTRRLSTGAYGEQTTSHEKTRQQRHMACHETEFSTTDAKIPNHGELQGTLGLLPYNK